MHNPSSNNEILNTDMEARKQKVMFAVAVVATFAAAFLLVQTAFAADAYVSTLQDLLTEMSDIIGVIFRAVGIILGIYAVGQLILAFKDENPDGKTRGATLLVVAVVLFCMPLIIETLSGSLHL